MVDVVMPRWGLTMESGTITARLKAAGERVTEGEPIGRVEADKATDELLAPASGVLREWLAAEAEEVRCGEPVARITTIDEWARRG